jgi:NitT/TauT family transport system permease protein
MKTKLKNFVIGFIPVLAFFMLWEVGTRYIPKGVLKPPSTVIPATLSALFSPKEQLFYHSLISFRRIGLGFLLAVIFGNVFAFFLGTYFRKLEKIFLPFFRICEKLNPFAIIPIFMIFFGIYDSEKVALVLWACIWPILTNTQEATKSVDPQLIRGARSMGASRLKVFKSVIFPYVLPSIFTGIKLAIRISFFMIIAAEMQGSASGIGWYYGRKNSLYNLNLVYGTVLYITGLAILLNYVFSKLEKHFLVWKEAAFR